MWSKYGEQNKIWYNILHQFIAKKEVNMKQNWILLDMHMHSNYSKYKDNSRVKEMDAKSFIDVMLKNKISLFLSLIHI